MALGIGVGARGQVEHFDLRRMHGQVQPLGDLALRAHDTTLGSAAGFPHRFVAESFRRCGSSPALEQRLRGTRNGSEMRSSGGRDVRRYAAPANFLPLVQRHLRSIGVREMRGSNPPASLFPAVRRSFRQGPDRVT
ncbi:hypothetical protein GCM10009854_18760 [Saccharopolyspora halophila]|uniref:Uncharacterized protein n=1 Tax=Saccharopolyspora halophila TaxID=405551 RepID=A0ABN3G201_9PSEU